LLKCDSLYTIYPHQPRGALWPLTRLAVYQYV
jgi:hypothetical protein